MLQPKNNRQMATVIVMGATNRAESIDPALRRAGRFDKEILIGVPDEEARIGIFKTMTKDMKLSGDFDLKVPPYVPKAVRLAPTINIFLDSDIFAVFIFACCSSFNLSSFVTWLGSSWSTCRTH